MEAVVDNEVEVNGERYYFARMDARVGSLVLARMVAQLQRVLAEHTDKAEAEPEDPTAKPPSPDQMIQTLLLNLNEGDFKFVQDRALNVVTIGKMVGSAMAKLPIMSNGSIAIPELKTDIDTIMQLTSCSLIGNLGRFFTREGLEKIFSGKVVSHQ